MQENSSDLRHIADSSRHPIAIAGEPRRWYLLGYLLRRFGFTLALFVGAVGVIVDTREVANVPFKPVGAVTAVAACLGLYWVAHRCVVRSSMSDSVSAGAKEPGRWVLLRPFLDMVLALCGARVLQLLIADSLTREWPWMLIVRILALVAITLAVVALARGAWEGRLTYAFSCVFYFIGFGLLWSMSEAVTPIGDYESQVWYAFGFIVAASSAYVLSEFAFRRIDRRID
ncbi:hypothetical protein LWF01_04875 [Saxibacter everestensis]|uniref:Uncharacterized protein n=1 Tax=Saxibacter everestensis TaxID=2909229 RepID=A0ABY8QXE2_9MICO|nr:hypothetical protein LWF01_04875 [Brevibacteriaceae bacterium ZFBP1038]